jgi:hypothetical protein
MLDARVLATTDDVGSLLSLATYDPKTITSKKDKDSIHLSYRYVMGN